MKINTRYFGEIEYAENDIINFPEGIIGFEEYNDYLLLKFDEKDQLIFCLQGIGEDAPVFIVVDPFKVVNDYEPTLSEKDKEDVLCANEENMDYYVIANIPQSMEDTVLNLRNPLVVNTENKKAKQILMGKYALRHPMFKKSEE